MMNHSGAFIKFSRGLIFTMMALVAFSLQPGIEFGNSTSSLTAVMAQEGCPESREAVINALVPSLGESGFVILDGSAFTIEAAEGETRTPIFESDLTEEDVLNLPMSLNANDFVSISLTRDVATALSVSGIPFTGFDVERPDDSLAELYIASPGSEEGRIEGFYIRSLEAARSSENEVEDNWYVYEPIRPLLFRIIEANGPSICTIDEIDSRFPSERVFTLVYDVSTINFEIDLDVFGCDEGLCERDTRDDEGVVVHAEESDGEIHSEGNHVSNAFRSLQCTAGAQCSVTLQLVGDYEFFKQNNTKGNGEREAKASIVSLINAIVDVNSNLFSLFGAHVNLNVDYDTIDIWTSPFESSQGNFGDAPGIGFPQPPNAYQLLCDFVNDSNHPHPDGDAVVHLFTGYNLSTFDPDAGIADGGDGWCDMACGGNNKAIVGLAQNIGGFNSNDHTVCGGSAAAPYNKITSALDAGHHSLSQQSQKLEPIAGATNFDGLFVQRWYLVAHEIGHNIGSRHSASDRAQGFVRKSVMHPNINITLNYWLTCENRNDINGVTPRLPCQ